MHSYITNISINYIGYLTAANGLGIGARKYLDALHNQGLQNINCVDITTLVKHQSVEKLTYHFISGIQNAHINILHVNAYELPYIIAVLGNHYFEKSYNIGVWAWELPNFPAEWHDRFDLLDEIWALSSFTAKAVSMNSSIPVTPISYCISGISPTPCRSLFELPENEFIFLFSYDSHSISYRKNPEAVINAFQLAFSSKEPIRLVIKINHGTHEDIRLLKELTQHLRVTIIDKTLTTESHHALIASCDSYISLHRSEGLGLGMAEAMSIGKPVIATGWSGNTDFMNICNSFLVKYRLIALKSAFSVYPAGSTVAEPDIEHAAELMRAVYSSSELRNTIGLRAKHDIENTMGEKVIGNILEEKLSMIAKKILFKIKPRFDLKIFAANLKIILGYALCQNPFTTLYYLKIVYPYFDKNFYCLRYKINTKFKFIAILHYQFIGCKKNWQPHPLFDTAWYLQANQDVKHANIEPYQHYIMHGWKEGRQPHPLCNSDLASMKFHLKTNTKYGNKTKNDTIYPNNIIIKYPFQKDLRF